MSFRRRPYHYTRGSISAGGTAENSLQINVAVSTNSDIDEWSEIANYSRYLYYSRLRRQVDPTDDMLLIPPHCIPNDFFYPNFITTDPDGKQSSIITIFALWNTMMGTSLLSMPWAMERAGAVPAVVLLTAVAGISFYTAYRTLEVFEANGNNLYLHQNYTFKQALITQVMWYYFLISSKFHNYGFGSFMQASFRQMGSMAGCHIFSVNFTRSINRLLDSLE